MKEKLSKITKQELEKMSIEQIADLKVETENIIYKLNSIINMCDETINSQRGNK